MSGAQMLERDEISGVIYNSQRFYEKINPDRTFPFRYRWGQSLRMISALALSHKEAPKRLSIKTATGLG